MSDIETRIAELEVRISALEDMVKKKQDVNLHLISYENQFCAPAYPIQPLELHTTKSSTDLYSELTVPVNR